MNLKTKVILKRFARAFVTGALSTAVFVTANDVTTWTELGRAITTLSLSLVIGGINGVLMAGDKLFRWKDEL